jgi:hypothetical protein
MGRFKIDGSLSTRRDTMDELKIAQIIAVLKQHEHDLSDGYQWYSGRRENKPKNVAETLREVAIAILTAIENPP